MNKYIAIATIAVTALTGGCNDAPPKERKITLYAADGKVTREWRTDRTVSFNHDGVWFLDHGGHYVFVSGTYVVEVVK